MKMEDLKFHLFETTEEEKDVLRKAKELITADDFYLCYILRGMYQHGLVAKVQSSLRQLCGGTVVLVVALDTLNHSSEFDFWDWYTISNADNLLARKVWIDKLLAYNG